MKVFCYFVEPASYTLDLASNVYDKHNIDYSFINSKTFAESDLNTNKNFLDSLGWPLVLMLLGFVLIGVSAVAIRINRRYIISR